MLTKEEVKNHFNKKERVLHDFENYGIQNNEKSNYTIDYYERPRQNLILNEIQLRHKPRDLILDVGCGVGALMIELLTKSYDVYGIDIADKMIEAAALNLKKNNYEISRLQLIDILEYQPKITYDSAILNGVIWYYDNKKIILEKLHSILNPNGYVYIMHRNALFNLFALNQGTLDFFSNSFFSEMPPEMREKIEIQFNNELKDMKVSVKQNGTLPKAYENPLTIHELYNAAGFKIVDIGYTYIHAVPPRFKLELPQEFYVKLQERFGKSWEGMLMGSQFLVVAQKI